MEFIKSFSEISKNDVAIAGGKGANLGEMTKSGLPVPPGFIILSSAYFQFIKAAKITPIIKRETEKLDIENNQKLETAAQKIQAAILTAKLPKEIASEILEAYAKLGNGHELVAIRSSATAEDLPEASFAGQQESFMNVKGEKDLLAKVSLVWASLFEPRSIFYRSQNGFDHLKVGIAAPVQKMIQSQASGIMFTLNPINNDQTKIAIEAVFGSGDAAVSGSVTPDQYLIDKTSLAIDQKSVVTQNRMLIKPKPGTTIDDSKRFRPQDDLVWVEVSKSFQKQQKITDSEILELVSLAKKIEAHYRYPQDIEWAKADSKIYIVQTRPITTIKSSDLEKISGVEDDQKISHSFTNSESLTSNIPLPTSHLSPPLLTGIAASPGQAIGPVQIISSPKELDKIKKGDVLVTTMTTPDFVPGMKRACAIVTDTGGRTSHAAIVSRELGIPAIVGTELATKTLKNHEIITVDGTNGKVYQGKVNLSEQKSPTTYNLKPETLHHTATKLYLNLAEPDLAEKMAQKSVDGVGLLRAEFMIAKIGQHPRYLIDHQKSEEFVDQMVEGITKFAKAFSPRPVIYRATDFRTNEYRSLMGGEKYETHEENPMIGFRGIMRYIGDPQVFKLELEAIKEVRRHYKNLHLMLPFVRTPEELIKVKEIISEVGLYRTGSFHLWIMVEVPSAVILLDKLIGAGIDGVSIGSNDLTQLILGIDRDNQKIAGEFDERNEAVQWALEKVIKTCNEHGITSSICGQAPSDYPELVKKLVEWGATSMSVDPDVIEKTREIIAKAEYDLIRSK